MKRLKFLALTMLASILAATSVSAADGSYALTNANLFDGVNNRITEDATVFVSDGKIGVEPN